MKSWHVKLSKKFQTHTAGGSADVVNLSGPCYLCLECETVRCLHVSAVVSFVFHNPVEVGVVREETNNPHAIEQVRALLPRVRNDWTYIRLKSILGDLTMRRQAQIDDARGVRGIAAHEIIFDDFQETKPKRRSKNEPKKQEPPTPFDLIELD